MFDIFNPSRARFRSLPAQPNASLARLMLVIAQPAPRPVRRIALDLLLRILAIAFVAILILVLLPVIAEAAA